MFTPRRIHYQSAVAFALACALLASVLSGAAPARPLQDLRNPDTRVVGSCSSERSCESIERAQDLRSPDARDAARTSSLAGTTAPRQDLRSPDARDAARAPSLTPRPLTPAEIAREQERYYSSYGEPEPVVPAQSPAPSDDAPWLPIALSAAAFALIAVAGAHRLLIRRRRVARATA